MHPSSKSKTLVTYCGVLTALALFACGGSAPDENLSTPSTHGPPAVTASKLPSGSIGVGTEQVQVTGELPTPGGGIGAFRTVCEFSHMGFDDPIVFPGQPGRSHLHAFFGNTGLNAHTTAQSLAATGNSTCRGGTVNRSAYWVPAMIDTLDGTPIRPHASHFYYKTGYAGIAPSSVRPFPPGLRMIAGDSKNSAPGGPFRFKCIGAGSDALVGAEIQNCPVGATLWQEIFFPQCWDGVNLDSPDHKSHMAYPSGGKCPSTHPVPTPEITFNILYTIPAPNAPLRWRLSSDTYDTSRPAGYSSHGDWFNGWKADIMETFVKYCDQAAADCHSHLLGDQRAIY
jgi:Domain of unknown function (DUF1996)